MLEVNRVTKKYATMTRTCSMESPVSDFNFLYKPMCATSPCPKTWLPRAGHLIYSQASLYLTFATSCPLRKHSNEKRASKRASSRTSKQVFVQINQKSMQQSMSESIQKSSRSCPIHVAQEFQDSTCTMEKHHSKLKHGKTQQHVKSLKARHQTHKCHDMPTCQLHKYFQAQSFARGWSKTGLLRKQFINYPRRRCQGLAPKHTKRCSGAPGFCGGVVCP